MSKATDIASISASPTIECVPPEKYGCFPNNNGSTRCVDPPPSVVLCSPNPGTPIYFSTNYVSLRANDFTLNINGKIYKAPQKLTSINSDPDDKNLGKYTTLEAIWFDNGIEMRMNMYFKHDGTFWYLNELRTYNGNNPPDWIYYKPVDSFGQKIQHIYGNTYINASPLTFYSVPNTPYNASLTFINISLQAFINFPGVSSPPPPQPKTGFIIRDQIGKKCKVSFDFNNSNSACSILECQALNSTFTSQPRVGSCNLEGLNFTVFKEEMNPTPTVHPPNCADGVFLWQAEDSCIDGGWKSGKYTCTNGKSGKASSITCTSAENLRSLAAKECIGSPTTCFPAPSVKPTCIPRPSCLDANPSCLISEPPTGWCQPNNYTPTPPPPNTISPTRPHTQTFKCDFNRDNVLDIIDFTIWLKQFTAEEKPLTPLRADCNGNGQVDIYDYNLLLREIRGIYQ